MSREVRQRLLDLARAKGALKLGEFILSSGQRSHYYFDGRLLSLDPEGAYLIGKEMVAIARGVQAQAIGGPSLGADPIVGATVAVSHLEGYPLVGFLVRSEPKGHGTRRLIEGPLARGMRVLIVDDVCTTGGSLFRAINAVEAEDCIVARVAVLLDRHQGGSDNLRKQGYDVVAFMEASPDGSIRVVEA
ncbi:Orotate phosphoribosyltransferase [bacterium HR23]|nr:Orotate phosphoribosyltransferase [bacterium HR23]